MAETLAPVDRIIVPLDVATEVEAVAWIDRLPQVTFWKVGLELFVSSGPGILEILKDRGKRIFLDLKFHDIPNTLMGACEGVARYGVDLLTVHTSAGKTALEAAARALQASTAETNRPMPRILGVTLLTSIDRRSLAFDLKIPLELNDYVLQMAMLAEASGLAGVVCSPQEAEALRRIVAPTFLLVCPGVRPTWAPQGDQSRTMTPAAAIAAGANYLVIGRPITQADDPSAAFARICEELAI